MTPSMIAWLTCTPFGPNSLARDCARARRANLPDANPAQLADPLTLAVAPYGMLAFCLGSHTLYMLYLEPVTYQ